MLSLCESIQPAVDLYDLVQRVRNVSLAVEKTSEDGEPYLDMHGAVQRVIMSQWSLETRVENYKKVLLHFADIFARKSRFTQNLEFVVHLTNILISADLDKDKLKDYTLYLLLCLCHAAVSNYGQILFYFRRSDLSKMKQIPHISRVSQVMPGDDDMVFKDEMKGYHDKKCLEYLCNCSSVISSVIKGSHLADGDKVQQIINELEDAILKHKVDNIVLLKLFQLAGRVNIYDYSDDLTENIFNRDEDKKNFAKVLIVGIILRVLCNLGKVSILWKRNELTTVHRLFIIPLTIRLLSASEERYNVTIRLYHLVSSFILPYLIGCLWASRDHGKWIIRETNSPQRSDVSGYKLILGYLKDCLRLSNSCLPYIGYDVDVKDSNYVAMRKVDRLRLAQNVLFSSCIWSSRQRRKCKEIISTLIVYIPELSPSNDDYDQHWKDLANVMRTLSEVFININKSTNDTISALVYNVAALKLLVEGRCKSKLQCLMAAFPNYPTVNVIDDDKLENWLDTCFGLPSDDDKLENWLDICDGIPSDVDKLEDNLYPSSLSQACVTLHLITLLLASQQLESVVYKGKNIEDVKTSFKRRYRTWKRYEQNIAHKPFASQYRIDRFSKLIFMSGKRITRKCRDRTISKIYKSFNRRFKACLVRINAELVNMYNT